MKKLVIILLSMFVLNTVEAQLKVEVKNGKYQVSEPLICLDETSSTGFIVVPRIKKSSQELIVNNLKVIIVGLGCSNTYNNLTIVFSNKQKIVLKASNKTSKAGGVSYFDLYVRDMQKLERYNISTIELTNGESLKSYKSEIKKDNYFIELFSITNN